MCSRWLPFDGMKIPHKPDWMMWDHNIHYHDLLLRQIPAGAQKALDVGCGAGLFARRVAAHVPQVVAIDRDPRTISTARDASKDASVDYIQIDLMDAELPLGAFDFVSCIAALHHMPLRPGLERLGSLVAPGGLLAVLGLYKLSTPLDYVYASATGLVDLAVGVVRHRSQPDTGGSGAILADPRETLSEIRASAARILPGAKVRRHMYDRYSLVYSRPPVRGTPLERSSGNDTARWESRLAARE